MQDLIIIGAGPAGLSAAVYCSRYKLDVIVLGKEVGGRAAETHKIENYLGFPSINGFELGQKFKEHAASMGAKIELVMVKSVKKIANGFEVFTENKSFQAHNVLFASGSEYRKLKIPGEDQFKGKGVSYCATCDGPFFRNKTVAVVGGGNSAAAAAILLSQYAEKVYIFYRGEKLKCFPTNLDQIAKNPKIEIVCGYNLKEIKGENVVTSIVLDKPYMDNPEIDLNGVFIEIGHDPSVELAMEVGVELDENNYIKTQPNQSTNVEGVYAAGDLTTNSIGFRQIITAAAEGAIASLAIYERVKAAKNS